MENSSLHKEHLHNLYNQNTVVEDAELTSFCYLKTLVLLCINLGFVVPDRDLHDGDSCGSPPQLLRPRIIQLFL